MLMNYLKAMLRPEALDAWLSGSWFDESNSHGFLFLFAVSRYNTCKKYNVDLVAPLSLLASLAYGKA